MQQPVIGPQTFHQPARSSRQVLFGRFGYLSLPLSIVLIIAISLFCLQEAGQIGIHLGYPAPTVSIVPLHSSVLRTNTSTLFRAQTTGRDLTYNWSFGDQQAYQTTGSSSGQLVSHIFASNGTFPVTVTVTDSLGQSHTASTTVQVLPEPPTASFTDTVVTYTYYGNAVSFDASGSQADPSSSLTDYIWNFGDGSDQTDTSSAYESHDYNNPGTYRVTLIVRDQSGQPSKPYTMSVVIQNNSNNGY